MMITLVSVSCAEPAPSFLLGDFVDDYGVQYSIRSEEWVQSPGVRYHIQTWDVDAQFLLALNDSANPSDGGLWTRIDWIVLDGSDEFQWAFCYAVYNAATEKEAVTTAPTDRDRPRNGCNGYPFSRMKRNAAATAMQTPAASVTTP